MPKFSLMNSPRFLLFSALAFFCASVASAQSTWTLRHQGAAAGDYLWSVTDGNFGAVAVGDGGKILHSTDGRNWIQRSSGTTGWIVAVTYGNGRYVAVGENGMILTSSNAIQWTPAAATGTTARLNNVLFAQNRFVAVGEGGATIASLDGGDTWSATTSNVGAVWLHGLAYGAGRWIATGQSGTVISSSDGINWVRQNSSTSQDLEAVALGETYSYNYGSYSYTYIYFLAIGANGTTQVCYFSTYTPTDGRPSSTSYNVYTTAKPNTSARFRSLTVGNKVYIATGENGSIYTAPSYYGPWSQVTINTTKNLVGAGFVQGTLMLVGENRTIYQSEQIYTSRLANISTRGVTGDGANTMIAGTVVEGSTPKQFLVRAAGPGLKRFGVTAVAEDPTLSVYNNAGGLIAANAGWSNALNWGAAGTAAASVGAFPFDPAAKDCALLVTLSPGAYTFQVTNAGGVAGNALIEAYDLDSVSATTTRAINISTRGQVGSAETPLIAGLVVRGQSSRTLLVRGIGPALGAFGLTGTLADPTVKVLTENGTVIATNDNWGETTLSNGRAVNADEIATATGLAGAFPLTSGSKDAALLVNLVPGNYTIQVSSATSAGGVALVEAYDVPNN
jgi:hypothetical protein